MATAMTMWLGELEASQDRPRAAGVAVGIRPRAGVSACSTRRQFSAAVSSRGPTKAHAVTATPFPLQSPRHLLSKAKREIDKLKAHAGGSYGEPDATVIADLTVNAAWSLWHVTDWIGNNDDPAVMRVVPDRIKKTGRDRTEAFQAQLRTESRDLEICWTLALRFKHFELDRDSPARGVLAPVSGAPTFSTGLNPSESLVDHSVGAQVAAGGPSTSTLYPKVTANGKRLRLTDVYDRAHHFLDQLLSKHGL